MAFASYLPVDSAVCDTSTHSPAESIHAQHDCELNPGMNNDCRGKAQMAANAGMGAADMPVEELAKLRNTPTPTHPHTHTHTHTHTTRPHAHTRTHVRAHT